METERHSNTRLIQPISSDDDSDVDLVTDYSEMNTISSKDVDAATTNAINNSRNKLNNNNSASPTITSTTNPVLIPTTNLCNNNNSTSTPHHTTNNNMVPIISVTPHSPGAKYSGILEDTLNHLQCIRESIVQMKNSNSQNAHYGGTGGLMNPSLSASKLFSSCPSLPDLTQGGNMWPNQNYGGLNSDRRKSWTAIEDLTSECAKGHKSVSLSSIDSEEQESLRAAERLHNRTSRNSTGGISTHSLNEAELARDFERIAAKRCLAPVMSRIPLQKSISTPSIAPIRNQNAKEENIISTTRHLSDTEDEAQDDRSLLCVRDKIESYADHPEKRRKRGSIFFRKKKDKTKSKTQTTNCESCGVAVTLSGYKDHLVDCKGKLKNPQKSSSNKKNSTNSHSTTHQDEQTRDCYEILHGPNNNNTNDHHHINYSDEAPLIRDEFLSEPPIGPHDLGAEPILGVAIDEHDSWSPSVPREIVKSLKDKQVKRQEHIYEFIMTEKHHCQTLLVMQKVFVESLQRHFSHLNQERMFPRLQELIDLHTGFLKKLRLKQREHYIVDSIADLLVEFFTSMSAQRLKNAYGEFCSNHRSALSTFKCYMTEDQTFSEWYKHCQTNPLLKKKGIPECILFVTQRLTKYPLLIDPLLKSSRDDKIEQEKLQKAMTLVKEILVDVDARVADKEKEDRQLEIFKRIDAKSYALFKKNKFKKSDIISSNRKLKFEGLATLMQGRSKMQTVLVVVLSDCLFFLQENSHKYTFFSPENKEGVVSLQKLLIREKAGTESRSIYIISSNPAFPEMYELKVQNPKDKNIWIQSIRAAVVVCPSDEVEPDDFMTVEQKQKLLEAKQAKIRDILYKMRQKDIDHAILLEEKLALHYSLFLENQNASTETCIPSNGVDAYLSNANIGKYKDLVTDDCDTVEIWKRVLYTVQEISHLASTLYSAATGIPLSRSFSSVGERQSDAYISPILPKRAETFGGFDERRSKNSPYNPNHRDSATSTITNFSVNIVNNTSSGSINKDCSASNQNEANLKRNSNSDINIDNNLVINRLSEGSTPSTNSTAKSSTENLRDHNYAALQVTHNLQMLLAIIHQQMTTIRTLQTQLASYRDNQKSLYRHNDQLEELRNLQDKLQEEKTSWLKTKETQEKDLEERRQEQIKMQEQIKVEQEDIKQQRDQLYRKMEILSSQGLLLSPSVALPIQTVSSQADDIIDDIHGDGNSTTDRRKDKWKTSTMPKAPPVNLLSATNAPKLKESSIKQQIPMKLSSLSSSKPNSLTSPNSSSSGSISQMFPLKLADKKNQNLTPNHSRTGSSPAVIQQQNNTPTGHPATRTNTYPKIPERYRLPSAPDRQSIGQSSPSPTYQQRSLSVHGQLPITPLTTSSSNHKLSSTTPTSTSPSSSTSPSGIPGGGTQKSRNDDKDKTQEEEVIYF